jgi:SAM-dependent methyltransferase
LNEQGNAATALYGSKFFEQYADGSFRSARTVLRPVFDWLSPRSVVDIGCGIGAWLKVARELGAEQVLGVDGGYVDHNHLHISADEFVALNIEGQNFREVLSASGRHSFDLVMSLEVAEHLPAARSAGFVKELTELGDTVLFSAAVPFQGGLHHVNEQWPEYWSLLFAGQGFRCVDSLRGLLWYRDDIEWWYAQNLLLFVRAGSEAEGRLPRAVTAGRAPLALVHPLNLLFQVLHSFRTYRRAAAGEEEQDFRTLAAAWLSGSTELPMLAAQARAASMPEAVDVFPLTRTTVMVPEDEIAVRDAELLRRAEEIASLQQGLADERLSRENESTQLRTELESYGARIREADSELASLKLKLAEREAALRRGMEDLASVKMRWINAEAARTSITQELARLAASRRVERT